MFVLFWAHACHCAGPRPKGGWRPPGKTADAGEEDSGPYPAWQLSQIHQSLEVCVCIYIYIHIYLLFSIHISARMYAFMHACMQACMHAYIRTYIHIQISLSWTSCGHAPSTEPHTLRLFGLREQGSLQRALRPPVIYMSGYPKPHRGGHQTRGFGDPWVLQAGRLLLRQVQGRCLPRGGAAHGSEEPKLR